MENTDKSKIEVLTKDITLLEGYIEDLFSFTPLPLCFVSPNGMVLEINPSFTDVTGYNEYEVVGEDVSLFVNKKDFQSLMNEAVEKEETVQRELTVKNKNGYDVAVFAFVKVRKMKDEDVSGLFFSFFDMTETKEINKKMEEKIEELERINRLTVGRENKMVELKEKIKKLEEDLEKYKKN